MLQINYWIIPVAALVPMIIGFIWYNPKVLGNAWMTSAGLTEEKLKGANMALIFGVSYVLACMLASAMMSLTIHQMGFQSVLVDVPGFGEEGSEIYRYFQDFMSKYGTNFRTFKHGALHGFIGALFIAFPILATNALFERKSWKYIWINTGYWLITFTLMGGLVCQFA
ncbi:MAG: DUF1761 domain-containing protein [Bacteroidetes bacterium]|nr:DUF1761 domain-containing protein [Bacteroidota bacterium]